MGGPRVPALKTRKLLLNRPTTSISLLWPPNVFDALLQMTLAVFLIRPISIRPPVLMNDRRCTTLQWQATAFPLHPWVPTETMALIDPLKLRLWSRLLFMTTVYPRFPTAVHLNFPEGMRKFTLWWVATHPPFMQCSIPWLRTSVVVSTAFLCARTGSFMTVVTLL